MQARVISERGIVVVHLSGRVDVETAEPFRAACLNKLAGQHVVFDFQLLGFVGSSGILPFLETMQAFNAANPGGFKFSGVGSEFRKVFAATPLHVIEIYDNAPMAIDAFVNPKPIGIPISAAVQAVPLTADARPNVAPEAFISFRSEPEDAPVALDEDEAFG